MRRYIEILRLPGILRVTASQLLARLPLGMIALATLLHVEHSVGSYAVAGVTVACVSVGEAVAAPILSRLVGVTGVPLTLMVAAVANAASLVLLSAVPLEGATPFLIGLLVGVSVPPVMPAIRAVYPRLVPRDKVGSLFALDTTAQELIWVGGPILAVLLSSSLSTAFALWVAAGITLVGTAWFVTTPKLADVTIPRATEAAGRVLRYRSVQIAMVSSGALVASFTALELGVVARFDGDEAIAGLLLAASALGSLIGGLLLGHRRFRLREIVGALAIVAAGTALAGVDRGVGLLLVALFISGFGFAPALAALYYMVSNEVDEKSSTEAFGWLNTAALFGGAAGAAIAGVVSESLGVPGAFLVAVLLATSATVSPAIARVRGPLPGLAH